jgi:hypothetical protein
MSQELEETYLEKEINARTPSSSPRPDISSKDSIVELSIPLTAFYDQAPKLNRPQLADS